MEVALRGIAVSPGIAIGPALPYRVENVEPPKLPISDIDGALTEDMVVTNALGMHLRPSQRLVQTVLKFSCEVHIQKEGHRVNAKSIMGLLTLAASRGADACRGLRRS